MTFSELEVLRLRIQNAIGDKYIVSIIEEEPIDKPEVKIDPDLHSTYPWLT